MKEYFANLAFRIYLKLTQKILKLIMRSKFDDNLHEKLINCHGRYLDDYAMKSINKEYCIEGAAYTSFNILSIYASAGNPLKASCSQCGEDLIIKHIFDNRGIKHPSYLDIGAHHPYILSNTAIFYASGSRGINVEPNLTLFEKFQKQRSEDINVQAAISDKQGYAELCIPKAASALASLIKDNIPEDGIQITKVKTLSLRELLDQYKINAMPDFISIDVEGMDEEIITQLESLGNYPKVICLETVEYSPQGTGEKRESLINAVLALGYFIYADTNINTIFVQHSFWYKS